MHVLSINFEQPRANAGENVGKEEFFIVLVDLENATANMKARLTVFYNTKCRLTV